VLADRPGPLAEGAGAVVVANAPEHKPWAALVEGHARLLPGVPVLVEHRDGPTLCVQDLVQTARAHHATWDAGT